MGRGGGAKSGGASGATALAAGDPRMPESARKFTPEIFQALKDEEELPPLDLSSLVGLVVGVSGVMTKQRGLCWAALLLSVQALANMRSAEQDLKTIMCSFSFAIMGLVSVYFAPNYPTTGTTFQAS